MKHLSAVLAATAGVSLLSSAAIAAPIEVSIENLSAENGLFLTPLWVGFHDGSFDLFTPGQAASNTPGLEDLAEEGNPAGLSSGGVDGVLTAPGGFAGAPVIDPGETTSGIFDLDPTANRYFSFASMIIPSNDAFIGNGNPTAYEVFDANGNLNPINFIVLGSQVWDAGTEVNDGEGAAFSNSRASTDEGGVVALHPGLGVLLGTPNAAGFPVGTAPDFSEADFTQAGFQVARITVSSAAAAVPEPSALAVFGLGLGLLFGVRRRRR